MLKLKPTNEVQEKEIEDGNVMLDTASKLYNTLLE